MKADPIAVPSVRISTQDYSNEKPEKVYSWKSYSDIILSIGNTLLILQNKIGDQNMGSSVSYS